MQNLVSKQTTGLLTRDFSTIKVFGLGIATIMGGLVTYSLFRTNTLQSKLMRLQILKLNKQGYAEQESELEKAFDKIDAIAGIYKAPVLATDIETTATPQPSITKSADGGNAAAMVELDPSQFLKEYSAPQIGGGFGATW